ncbi:MAG: TetR/AcrR family transcriptional regulator [Candidatus Eisenbacteria bacterium]|uniref:TetR/AcrR family transcriptional regulator n=1 Tax=Eiseniibacteriota bacterium TaxID=2212470 RepID=A0A948WBZ4_UNCEI|nr:TetR/AcrR family transcriptional regulator [Candidatus Eisenbacteria bacterium]MBU1949370.1 TetR/AcrR family transcriptional regulator [Candidatus Eisenbacteria bacterium]MBU2690443.1 TetR/AcrR family transcriptional regulator [Candidatus Eisenbacteria bacterium]
MARRKASEETRESFIIAALNLCREGGPEAVSARRLGRLLGLSQMAVYRHFQDMEDLLAHAWDRTYQQLLDHIQAAIFGENPFKDLRAGLQAYVGFGVDNPGLYRLMFFHHFERMEYLTSQKTSLLALDLLRKTLATCLEQKSISVDEQRLHFMTLQAWFTVHGLTTMAISGRFQRVTEFLPEDLAGRLIDEICESFLNRRR